MPLVFQLVYYRFLGSLLPSANRKLDNAVLDDAYSSCFSDSPRFQETIGGKLAPIRLCLIFAGHAGISHAISAWQDLQLSLEESFL